jgi:hypothetical protein
VPHQNARLQRTLPQPITGGKGEPDVAYWAQCYASPVGNTMVRLAAEACVRGQQLGADAIPDLLAVSFSATDVIGHQFGPDSVEARDALLRLDRELAELLGFFDRQVGSGNWALFLTADHGVGPTPEWAKANGLDAGRGPLQQRARAAAEAALTRAFGAPPSGSRWFTHVGEYSMFFDRTVLQALANGRDEATMLRECGRVAAAAAVTAPAIAAAYPTEALQKEPNDGDPLREVLVQALAPGRAGDVQLVGRPYWLDGITPASHGTPHAYDREVAGFACGGGAPSGAVLPDPITPGFGVVWFAQLLGLARPGAAVDAVPAVFSAPR